MEYMVAHDADLGTFLNIVNTHLEQGWELSGGIAVSPWIRDGENQPTPFYYQAMARRTPQEFSFA